MIQETVPPHIIDKGIPTAGLIADVMTAKFGDHLPFNLSPDMITLQNVIKGLISLRKVPSDEAVERGQELLALVGFPRRQLPRPNYPVDKSGASPLIVAWQWIRK